MNEKDTIKAFYAGMKSALKLYAYWSNGVEHVGTSGTPLKQALGDTDREEKLALKNLSSYLDIMVTP